MKPQTPYSKIKDILDRILFFFKRWNLTTKDIVEWFSNIVFEDFQISVMNKDD